MRLAWRWPSFIGAITPFNDPLNLVAHKLAPALVAGNGVVLKPADQTPLTALAFVELLVDAGVPGQRLAVVPGRGATVGAAMVSHPLVDMVSFTGGYATEDAIAREAGAKKTLMELGGIGAVLEVNAGGTAETNNTARINVTSTLAPYPDLVVTDVFPAPGAGWP